VLLCSKGADAGMRSLKASASYAQLQAHAGEAVSCVPGPRRMPITDT